MKWSIAIPVAAVILQLVLSASASVITLSGGDAGEGLTLNPALVQGVYNVKVQFPAVTSATLQSVTFPTVSPATFTVPSLTFYNGDYAQLGVSANDSALTGILNKALDNPGADILVTIGNLTAGQSYVVNWLLTDNTGFTRNMNLTYNTELSPRDSFMTVNGLGYNVQETVVAQAGGIIQIDANSTGFTMSGGPFTAGDFPILSAIIISTVPVPEPASLALIGFGATGLLVAGRLAQRRR